MFISNSLNMPSPILPLKVAHDLLIQEKILGKTSKKKKNKGRKRSSSLLTEITEEAWASIQAPSSWSPGWGARPPPTGVALTLALASRVASASAAMDLCNCTGIRTSLISTRATRIPHSSVASSSKVCFQVKRKDVNQNTGNAIKDSAIFHICKRNTLFSFWIYSIWSETIWEENRSSYRSLPGIEVNPRKDSETKVGISFKRGLLSRCTQTIPKEHTLFI